MRRDYLFAAVGAALSPRSGVRSVPGNFPATSARSPGADRAREMSEAITRAGAGFPCSCGQNCSRTTPTTTATGAREGDERTPRGRRVPTDCGKPTTKPDASARKPPQQCAHERRGVRFRRSELFFRKALDKPPRLWYNEPASVGRHPAPLTTDTRKAATFGFVRRGSALTPPCNCDRGGFCCLPISRPPSGSASRQNMRGAGGSQEAEPRRASDT